MNFYLRYPCSDITVYLHIPGSFLSSCVSGRDPLARYVIKAPLDYRIDFEWPTGLDNALQVQPLNSVLALRQDCCLLPATSGGGGGGRECPEASLPKFLVTPNRNAHPSLLIIPLCLTSCIVDLAIDRLNTRAIDPTIPWWSKFLYGVRSLRCA